MIEALSLRKRFGSTLAVDDLSFTVRPGHVTGFLGPNGAGKSTTMRMLLGLDRPTRGTVRIDSRVYGDTYRPLHHVGAVLEVRAVHGGRSAHHHLLCLAQSNGIPARRVDEVLDLVGLTGVGSRRAGTFSLGMSQRLGLAAALLGDPPVLLCDEPINGLDPEGILWIRTLLRDLAAQGRTVFVSSHLMSEMALTADHLIVIGQGRLLADASTADFVASSSRGFIAVRSSELARLAQVLGRAGGHVSPSPEGDALHVTGMGSVHIGDLALAAGVPIHELTTHDASLEAAYMEITRDDVEFHTDTVERDSSDRVTPNRSDPLQ